jgi:hypothetical protein
MNAARCACALFAAFAIASCHRPSAAVVSDASAPSAEGDAEGPVSKATTRAARCAPASPGYALDDGHALGDLEIGDAVAGKGGLAVAVIHRSSSGRVAAVATLPGDAASMKVRDLGATLGDAPPPRVAWRGADLLALSYGVSKRPEVRELTLYTVPVAGDVQSTGSIAEARDDSLAFDLTSTLVVWDEARGGNKAGAPPRGVIRVAEIGLDGRPGAPRDASPAESDAEMPRIGANAVGGALVFWIARRPEIAEASDASAAPSEVTGEAPTYSWLEVISLDAHGAPVGAARRLTSLSGHVSTYDIEPLPKTGIPRAEMLVAVRDDGEAIDGSGGALLRLRVRVDGQDPPVAFPVAFPTDGLGRGGPAFVDGTPPWLTWVAAREEGRLLALDGSGAPLQLPSEEPSLDEGRALAWLDQGKRLLAATPGDPVAQLRVLSCGSGPR